MTHAEPCLGQAAQPSQNPRPQDAVGQSLQPASGPEAATSQYAAAGQSPIEVQRPLLVPMPSPRRMRSHTAKQQATEATKPALQTEKAHQGVTALQFAVANPVTALQATAVAQSPTAAAQSPTAAAPSLTAAAKPNMAAVQAFTATASPPAAVAQPSTARATSGTAAVHATAHHAADAAQVSEQPASHLPTQQPERTATAAPDADAAVSPGAAISVPASIPADQAREPTTAQMSSMPKKGVSNAKGKQRRSTQAGSAPTAAQTQHATQASDSAAASGSLQGYFAHASPRSISKLKQDLRKPSATDTTMAVADQPDIQPAMLDTLQLQAASAHRDAAAAEEAAEEATDRSAGAKQDAAAEVRDTAALQQQSAADSADQVEKCWGPIVADTLRQFHALRQDIFAYASKVPDPVAKQKLADALAGRPVSPTLPYSSDALDLRSSSDSDAELDQDTTGALLPVLDMYQERSAIPVRQSSNRIPTSSPLHTASDALLHKRAQLVPHSPPSPGLHPAQPTPKRPPAMRSGTHAHSNQPSSQCQPAQPDQATLSPMPSQESSAHRGLTNSTQGSLPDAAVLPTAHVLPSDATVLAQSIEQTAGRKRGASSSDAHLASLAPGTL